MYSIGRLYRSSTSIFGELCALDSCSRRYFYL